MEALHRVGVGFPLHLDSVGAHWRIALDAAHDALEATSSCPTPVLPAPELNARSSRLARERDDVADALDALAREEHVTLLRRLSAPRPTNPMLGLPTTVTACVFDLEGVLTGSAALHAAAWKETFNELLYARFERLGERFAPYVPFSRSADYDRHVHGKPRLDGVRAFLASRGISLPEGHPEDPPGNETVHGLANRKNQVFLRRLDQQGVTAFEGSRRYLEAAREAGLACAVVSASASTRRILVQAELADLVDDYVDPAPDTLVAACERLNVRPEQAAVFETTTAGIVAGRAAGFDLVVGVDRAGQADALRAAGADLVVTDLTELLSPDLRA